jgi:hypothetical protein
MQIADKIVDRIQGGKQFSKFKINNQGLVDVKAKKRRAKKRLKDGWTIDDLKFIDDEEIESKTVKKKTEINEDKLDGFFMICGDLEYFRSQKEKLFLIHDSTENMKKTKKKKKNQNSKKKTKKSKSKASKKKANSSKKTKKKSLKGEKDKEKKNKVGKEKNSKKSNQIKTPKTVKKRENNKFKEESLLGSTIVEKAKEIDDEIEDKPSSKINLDDSRVSPDKNNKLQIENEVKEPMPDKLIERKLDIEESVKCKIEEFNKNHPQGIRFFVFLIFRWNEDH